MTPSASDIARELDRRQARRRWRRHGLAAGATDGAVLLAMLYLHVGHPSGSPAPAVPPTVRLSSTGLTIDGTTATVTAVVTACQRAGSCSVIVTGDARQGDVDQLLAALHASGVNFTSRGV